jgi:putative PIN family toxin of toxin-antitoxin system
VKRDGRWVFDTNTLVSHLLLPDSVPNRAVKRALDSGLLLVSEETLGELDEVLIRPKFRKYVSLSERRKFFELLGRVAIHIRILRPITACRDPKDDKFLSVAINGSADAILSGDKDLLSLNPFLGIPILTPAEFLRSDLSA